MPYLIDSDVVIDHLDDSPPATQLLEKLATDGIAVSIITYMEAYQGVLHRTLWCAVSAHMRLPQRGKRSSAQAPASGQPTNLEGKPRSGKEPGGRAEGPEGM